jgi:hypothetical protein
MGYNINKLHGKIQNERQKKSFVRIKNDIKSGRKESPN